MFWNEFRDCQPSEIPTAETNLAPRNQKVVEEIFRWGRQEAELISWNPFCSARVSREARVRALDSANETLH